MELKNKVYCFLGDSITEGVNVSSIDKTYWGLFGARNGVEVTGYGIGGTRIAPQHMAEDNNSRYFQTRVPEIRKDADVVVVFGGTNDFGHGDAPLGEVGDTCSDTFCGAFYNLLGSLYETFPKAQLVVMTPTHRSSEKVTVNEIGLPCHVLADYVNVEKEIAAMLSVPVLDLWAVSGMQPSIPVSKEMYMDDGLHPNDAGHQLICERLEGFLKAL